MARERQPTVNRPASPRPRSGRACPAFLLLAFPAILAVLTLTASTAPARADELLDQRRVRVKQMDQAAKERLMRRLACFRTMTADQQERLRRLHEQLASDPQAAELRAVMDRYYEWLKTLKPYQTAELAELVPAERVERIKKIRQEQARKEAKRPGAGELARLERFKRLLQEQIPKSGKRLNGEDVEGLLHWLEVYLETHESRLIDGLPASHRAEVRRQLARLKDPERRRQTLALLWLRSSMADPGKLPELTPSELAELRARLSPSTRERLAATSEPEQLRAIGFWLRLLLLHYTAGQHLGRVPSEVSDEELAEFLEHHLNAEQRDRLLGLSPEDMQRELWILYLRSKAHDPPVGARPPRVRPKTQAAKASQPGGKKSLAEPASISPPSK